MGVLRVDDEGIRATSRREVVLDVLLDGRRVWSFWLHRDGVSDGAGHLVAWPKVLRPYLSGEAHLRVVVHATGEVLHDAPVVLGDAPAGSRIAVATAEGLPLALDKAGRLVQTFDTRTREHVEPLMAAIEAVLAALRDGGVQPFLAYGTLLGAVRDGRLIGHDSDADLGYLSRRDHPADVIRESFALERHLLGLGLRVWRYSGAAFQVVVTESDGSRRGLDVFAGFHRQRHLHLMGEVREPFRPEWLLPLGEVTLEGHRFPAPADTDRFLTATYGPAWRVPDPAFHFETPASTRRRLDGWFRGMQFGRTWWSRRYEEGAPDAAPGPSTLVRDALADGPEARLLVDLGCGRGQDTLWAARQGVRAVGLDFAARGYQDAAAVARREGLPAEFRPLSLLELRSVLPTAALLARYDGPRVLLARHLVDAVYGKARVNLWRAARTMTRDGGRMHLEFMTRHGNDGFGKANGVRQKPLALVEAELADSGARVLEQRMLVSDAPAGLTPATICRMVVTWER